MTVLGLIVFSHVAAVIGLFAALALEGASVRQLRRSTSYEQARLWAELWSWLLPVGMPSTLAVLASGLYLATTLHAWGFVWVAVAIPTLVVIAVAGGLAEPHRKRLRTALAKGAGSLPGALQAQLRHPILVASWRFRAALLIGLVLEMTTMPGVGSAWLVIAVAALLGLAWSAGAWRKEEALAAA